MFALKRLPATACCNSMAFAASLLFALNSFACSSCRALDCFGTSHAFGFCLMSIWFANVLDAL